MYYPATAAKVVPLLCVCVAVCCSVLKFVEVCCSVLQCVTVCVEAKVVPWLCVCDMTGCV